MASRISCEDLIKARKLGVNGRINLHSRCLVQVNKFKFRCGMKRSKRKPSAIFTLKSMLWSSWASEETEYPLGQGLCSSLLSWGAVLAPGQRQIQMARPLTLQSTVYPSTRLSMGQSEEDEDEDEARRNQRVLSKEIRVCPVGYLLSVTYSSVTLTPSGQRNLFYGHMGS